MKRIANETTNGGQILWPGSRHLHRYGTNLISYFLDMLARPYVQWGVIVIDIQKGPHFSVRRKNTQKGPHFSFHIMENIH
jgi:hypothetical protein